MSKSLMSTKTLLGLEDHITFGDKFYCRTIQDAITLDPEYVEWCTRQKGLLPLNAQAKKALNKALDEIELENKYVIQQEIKRATKIRAADGQYEDIPF